MGAAGMVDTAVLLISDFIGVENVEVSNFI